MSTSTVVPSLRYHDAHAAISWLERTLGLVRYAVHEGPDNTVAHAELTFGSGMIMLGSTANKSEMSPYMTQPSEIGGLQTHAVYLISAETVALHARAVEAGAEIVLALREMPYGGHAFVLRDPEGYLWSVGEYDPYAARP